MYYSGQWYGWIRKYPVTLFTGSEAGTVTLSESVDNFKAIDIYFTDNNGLTGGYTRIYSPSDKKVCLSIIEAGSGTKTYIRRTTYTISGTTLTPDATNAGYVLLNGTTVTHFTGSNYLRIVRVMGYDSGTVL
jgi:hypothetical protein